MEASRFTLLAISALVAVGLPAAAATIHVPDDQPTIQAGIDAASYGDTVLVACGTYYEHSVSMKSGVCLTSETGLADCVTIDAQGLGCVMFGYEVDTTSAVEGFTLTQGLGGMSLAFSSPAIRNCTFRANTSSRGGGISIIIYSSPTLTNCTFEGNIAEYGGGMECRTVSSPTLTNCTFEGNIAEYGGGMNCEDWSSPTLENCSFVSNYANNGGGASCVNDAQATFTNCVFLGNEASTDGGGIFCGGEYGYAPAVITNCTLSGNHAGGYGGGVFCSDNSPSTLSRTIISFSTAGEAVYCGDAGSVPDLTCCDLYGNAGGDWVGCIANQYSVYWNFSLDPLFCLDSNPDQPYSLHEDSPCLPNSSPCYYLVGALGLGCGPVSPVADVSWGSIKAVFR